MVADNFDAVSLGLTPAQGDSSFRDHSIWKWRPEFTGWQLIQCGTTIWWEFCLIQLGSLFRRMKIEEQKAHIDALESAWISAREAAAMRSDVSLRVFVRGRVQGVGFRFFVHRRGRELGLKGFVRNLSDGSRVEVVAEGSRAALEALQAALKLGPPGSNVESVDTTWGDATGAYTSFDIV